VGAAQLAIQPQSATERCPWCGNGVTRTKFLEIEEKIAERERKKLAEERARLAQELRDEARKNALRLKAETDKKVAALAQERDAATARVKELREREATIRKEAVEQAEARTKAEIDKKVAAAIAAREKAAEAKFKLVEARKKTELEQQRAALERDRDSQLLKLQSQHNREREQMKKKIDALSRQQQRATADELGEGAEVDAYEALRDAFKRDDIARIKRGQPGADIRHRALHKGDVCGTIMIDSKNRQGWLSSYVTKLREDQVTEKAEHAVLATTVFPSGKKELYIDEDTGVIVVNRARVVEIVGLLRDAMVRMHLAGLSRAERSHKSDQLYAFITSETYRQHQVEAQRLTAEILELDVEEQRTHGKVWQARGKIATRLRNAVREIDTEVSAILEGRAS
jgi:Uncharacterized protein conserved in bacteria (DUF2130)